MCDTSVCLIPEGASFRGQDPLWAFRSTTVQPHLQGANSLMSKGILNPDSPSLTNLNFRQDLPSILDPSNARQPFYLKTSTTFLLRAFFPAAYSCSPYPALPLPSLPLKDLFKDLSTFCKKPYLTLHCIISSSVPPTWLVYLTSIHLVSALCPSACAGLPESM